MITKEELKDYIEEHFVELLDGDRDRLDTKISKLADGSYGVLLDIKIDRYDDVDFNLIIRLLEILNYTQETLNVKIQFAANRVSQDNFYNAKSFIDYKKTILHIRFKVIESYHHTLT